MVFFDDCLFITLSIEDNHCIYVFAIDYSFPLFLYRLCVGWTYTEVGLELLAEI